MRIPSCIVAAIFVGGTLLTAGCAGLPGGPGLAAAGDGRLLLVDEFDKFDDALDEFEDQEQQKAKKKRRRTRRTRRKAQPQPEAGAAGDGGGGDKTYQIGARSGALFFVSADIREPKGGRLLVGGFYRQPLGPGFYEVGLDLGANTADISGEELIIGRFNYFYFPMKNSLYVEGGLGAIFEIYNDESEAGGFLELGAGYGFQLFNYQWDARLGIWQLLGSDNVKNMLVLSVGIGF